MKYMERHAEARRNPTSILPEVRSVVMVAMEYGSGSGYRVPGFGAEQFSPEPGTRNPIPGKLPAMPADRTTTRLSEPS